MSEETNMNNISIVNFIKNQTIIKSIIIITCYNVSNGNNTIVLKQLFKD